MIDFLSQEKLIRGFLVQERSKVGFRTYVFGDGVRMVDSENPFAHENRPLLEHQCLKSDKQSNTKRKNN